MGVSIESASYMENNNDLGPDATNDRINTNYAPKLFSEDNISETNYEANQSLDDSYSNKLFDQDTNEDEDFEIPAFLRKQKF